MSMSLDWVIGLVLVALCVAAKTALAGTDSAPSVPANAFFAMDTGTKDANHTTAKPQAEMLKELGYAGIGYSGFEGLPEMLAALDANGLKMFTVYFNAELNKEGWTYDPGIKDAIKALKGRDTLIWLTVTSKAYPPSSPEGDAKAVQMLRELASMAAESGLRIALYPHTGFWVERVEDCIRLARKTDRKNVGVTFNLCHWLKVDGDNLAARLKDAMPYLFVVTINGADRGEGWDQLIQTLDRGSYDLVNMLNLLLDLGYHGPIGLQGYGIKGDVYDNLKRSMAAWRRFHASDPTP